MSKYPLVTIVTPTYNQANYIAETIESVLNQSYPNIEYIVINDGSTDNTVEVLEQFKGRCTVISQENIGQSATLNKGWAKAAGEYIGYISSDDKLKPNCISSMVNAFKSGGNSCGVTYCDYDIIDHRGQYIKSVFTADFSKETMYRDLHCFPGPGAIFLADAFRELGGWSPSTTFIPDLEFWLKLGQKYEFRRVPELLAEFRVHKGSGSVRKIAAKQSDEIVQLVESNPKMFEPFDLNQARFNALVISGRSHLQSARILLGLRRMAMAVLVMPSSLVRINFYRHMISGLLRRFYYND